MNREARLIKKYNQPNSVLIIANYPPRGGIYNGNLGGVASFTKNSVLSLSEYLKLKQGGKLIVVCESLEREEIYEEKGILVIRVFKRNHFSLYFKIWQILKKLNQVDKVLIEFEFAAYGDFLLTSFFPVFILSLCLLGKKINLVLHQVLFDLAKLSGHVGLKTKSPKISFFNFLLKVFYFALVRFSSNVVVLEEELKNRLMPLGVSSKVVVIPHGVDGQVKPMAKGLAKRRLGIKTNQPVILYFGYLTWYKGADFLIKNFMENKIKIGMEHPLLVMAGEESTTQREKEHYQKFIKRIYALAKKSKNIIMTGFVKEEEIPLYFSAADLVVLPYRTFMSSSGPLSLAFSYGKPFMVSNNLAPYFTSADFKLALTEVDLEGDDLTFSLKKGDFKIKIEQFFRDGYLGKAAKLSQIMAQKRDFTILAEQYDKVIRGESEKLALGFAPHVSPEPVVG